MARTKGYTPKSSRPPKRLTKADAAALRAIRARIDVKHPGFRGSEEIKQALGNPSVSRYLNSWVFPLLDFLAEGEQYIGQRSDIKKDAIYRFNSTHLTHSLTSTTLRGVIESTEAPDA